MSSPALHQACWKPNLLISAISGTASKRFFFHYTSILRSLNVIFLIWVSCMKGVHFVISRFWFIHISMTKAKLALAGNHQYFYMRIHNCVLCIFLVKWDCTHCICSKLVTRFVSVYMSKLWVKNRCKKLTEDPFRQEKVFVQEKFCIITPPW